MQEMAQPADGKNGAGANRKKGERPLWLNEIEETLVESLGTPVQVRYSPTRAKITIECLGRDEFDNPGPGGDFRLTHLSPELSYQPPWDWCPNPSFHVGAGLYRGESGDTPAAPASRDQAAGKDRMT